ncbi:hypothetical protein RI367_001365 [Sorochytrium milnesiophthora]
MSIKQRKRAAQRDVVQLPPPAATANKRTFRWAAAGLLLVIAAFYFATPRGSPAPAATSLVPYLLATDFLTCRQYRQAAQDDSVRPHCCEAVTLLPCLDGTRANRLRLEIKARVDIYFQELVRQSAGTLAEVAGAQDRRHVNASLLQALADRQQRVFLSTDTKVDERVKHWREEQTPRLVEYARFLQQQRTLVDQLPNTARAYNPDDLRLLLAQTDPVARYNAMAWQMGVSEHEQSAILRVFNVSALPTLADVHAVFPEFDPVRGEPVPPSNEALMAPILSKHQYLVSDEFVYFYSNWAVKTCELLTAEYIHALSSYLLRRLKSIQRQRPTVLEIAAGNGRLTYLLNQTMHSAANVLASDLDGVKGTYEHLYPVARESHLESLARVKPDIVLCSWMPKDVDLSAAIRDTPSVQEYVLIGETDHGVSGNAWLTWGLTANPREGDDWTRRWRRHDLQDISLLQIGRSDTPWVPGKSRTVAWRRVRA